MTLRVVAIVSVLVLAACDTGSRGSGSSPTSTTTATTVAPTTTTSPPISYEIQPGDTLTAIAAFFGVSSAAIIELNDLANADQLTAGEVLSIPPVPPLELVVTPPDAPAGETFLLDLTGANAGEVVTFTIQSPDGGEFTGPPHRASPEGSVSTGYHSSGDEPGIYRVMANGDRGTSARASFRVSPG